MPHYLSRLISVCILSMLLYCSSALEPSGNNDSKDQTNDLYEPNNSKPTATLFVTNSLINLVCSSGEYDYYKIPVDSNLQTTVRFLPKISCSDYGNCFISLYGKDSTPLITKSASTTLSTLLTFYSKARDTFYVSIYKYLNDAPGIIYSLRLFKDTVIINDSKEPNDNQLTASILTDSTTVAFVSTASDTDYYKIALSAKDSLMLSVTSDSSNIDSLTSKLVTSKSTMAHGWTRGNVTSFICFANQADTCYLKIYSSSPRTSSYSLSRYTLTMTKTTFANDTFEPNDTKLTSKTIGLGFYDSLKLVGSENDYYKVSFDTTMYVEAVLRINKPSLTPFSMNFESIDSLMISENIRSDSIKLSYFVSARDSIYLNVNNISESTTSHLLLYSLELRATPMSEIDSLEPNNNVSTAVPITKQSVQSIVFYQNDTDYYKIDVNKGECTQIKIVGDSLAGNSVYSQLQYINKSPVVASVSNGYSLRQQSTYASIHTYNSTVNDTLILIVSRKYSLSINKQNKYSVSVTKTLLPEDRYEPNNTTATGTLLNIGTYDSLFSNVTDYDYFKFISDTAILFEVKLQTPVTMSSSDFLNIEISDRTKVKQLFSGKNKNYIKFNYFLPAKDSAFFIVGRDFNSSTNKAMFFQYSLSLQTDSIEAIDGTELNDSR